MSKGNFFSGLKMMFANMKWRWGFLKMQNRPIGLRRDKHGLETYNKEKIYTASHQSN